MTNLQMKYADINRRFTEIVAEWLTKGYTINTATMNGSQGENAKLDLTDGKKIVRILVARFSEHAANVEGIEIVAGEATDAKVIPNGSDNWATIWNNNLKVLQRERFFKDVSVFKRNDADGTNYYVSYRNKTYRLH